MDLVFPGCYGPRDPEQTGFWEPMALRSLKNYPEQRERILAVSRSFDLAFARGEKSFAHAFPDYRQPLPVFLLHSLGEMDGGTRTIAGTTYLIFGADVIARIHDEDSIGPFLDHELFHSYHGLFFEEDGKIWGSLWSEGLAVYTAAKLNPGADDRMLLLTLPRPMREEVDANWGYAISEIREALDRDDNETYRRFFFYREGDPGEALPPRAAYYIGYRIAAKLGETYSLNELAHMNAAQVRPLLNKALDELAASPSQSSSPAQ